MIKNTNAHKLPGIIKATFFLFFIIILTFSLSCSKTEKVYKIGVLSGLNFFYQVFEGFKTGMTELGYIEGKTIIYDVHKYDIDIEGYKKALNKFVEDKVDLIFAFPTEAAIEAKAITAGTKIPVVFGNSLLEGSDLIKNVQEPGDNITGIRFPTLELTLRRLELMMELSPKTKRIWIPYLEGYPTVSLMLEKLKAEADKIGVKIIEVPAKSPDDITADLDKRAKQKDIGIDAMLCIVEPISLTPGVFTIFGKFADEHKIPVGGPLLLEGEYGSVFGLLPNNITMGKQAAVLADKVLKGTPAGTIPVGTPEMELRLNYKVAQKLGITIPESLMSQAVEIIK